MRDTAWLEADGYCVIRFWNNEVFENLDFVLQSICNACGGATPPIAEITRWFLRATAASTLTLPPNLGGGDDGERVIHSTEIAKS